MTKTTDLNALLGEIEKTSAYREIGTVDQVIGLIIESRGPKAKLSDVCMIETGDPFTPHILAEVVGFKEGKLLLMPMAEMGNLAPGARGYTPSVFAFMPKLLERSGTSEKGSITGLYTVLVEGDDMNEPVADMVRGLLDGHVVLSRELAEQNHFPAVDVLASISRLMVSIASKEHREAAGKIRDLMAAYKRSEDLINIGAYVQGANPRLDLAVGLKREIDALLRQDVETTVTYDETVQQVLQLGAKIKL